MDVYSEFSGTVLLKIENRANNQIFIENPQEYTIPGEWATLRFAFDTASVDLYEAMVIFFDFGGKTAGNAWYYDNIQGPPMDKEDWGVTVNLSVVDEMGISDLFADIWINPGEDYNDDDPNTCLINMELTDEDADPIWTASSY